MAWSVDDRAAVLALREQEAETCTMCGHPMSECRDPKTEQTWSVVEEICQPSRIAQAVADNNAKAEKKVRGVVLKTVRNRR